MMQNGFRRIALAQGLLPERPAFRESIAHATLADTQPADLAETAAMPQPGWDRDPEMRVASVA